MSAVLPNGLAVWQVDLIAIIENADGPDNQPVLTDQPPNHYPFNQQCDSSIVFDHLKPNIFFVKHPHPQLKKQIRKVDVCVVGGGMAGLIAAIAAARRGASVLLIHDRPVFGGNASSEVRMWICGAHGHHRKETGILEEIQLANLERNPEGLYSVWDSVLFEFGLMTPGLTSLLNTTVNNASVEAGRLKAVDAWQLTTQTWHRVEAEYFIDASGDSILAPLSGAETRVGREGREEFGESLAPRRRDLRTMGNTLLLQLEETPREQAFTPPAWAYRFDDTTNLPSRVGSGIGENFWWLELGGLQDTIGDSETIRDELLKIAWGVWDYMKNIGPQAEKLRNWRVRWLGSLPGKRENRRYIGDYIMTQNDIEAGGQFEDIVAYGGWSMDDHHPGGLYYPGKATLFHKVPSPYGIPLRSLYSRNVANLLCAGRNISVTHCALSSTRVMATCALTGQAAGTAAALCVKQGKAPARLGKCDIRLLQEQLMEDDCWLPGVSRQNSRLMEYAIASDDCSGNLAALRSGAEREPDKTVAHWEGPTGSSVELEWETPVAVACLRLIFDSDLNDSKRMPCRYPLKGAQLKMPSRLVKDYRIEIREVPGGPWLTIHEKTDNRRRRVVLPVKRTVAAVRWTGLSTWGDPKLRVFAFDALDHELPLSFEPGPGHHWNDVVAGIPSQDLQEPDHGLESK